MSLHKPRTPYEGKYKEDIVAVLHSTITSLKNLAKHIAFKYTKLEGGKIREFDLIRRASKIFIPSTTSVQSVVFIYATTCLLRLLILFESDIYLNIYFNY